MKQYTSDEIIKIVKRVFNKKTIMFMYYSGSIAYGTTDINSDIDVTVVLADMKGCLHMNVSDIDIFAYGIDRYLEKQRLIEDIPLFFRMHIDDVLTIDKTLIYLDNRFINEFNIYKDIKIENNLKSFLDSFISYHGARLVELKKPAKWEYHILRMRGLLDHLDKTKRFEMVIEEPWKVYLSNYKANFNNEIGESYQKLIKEQLVFLINYKDRL